MLEPDFDPAPTAVQIRRCVARTKARRPLTTFRFSTSGSKTHTESNPAFFILTASVGAASLRTRNTDRRSTHAVEEACHLRLRMSSKNTGQRRLPGSPTRTPAFDPWVWGGFLLPPTPHPFQHQCRACAGKGKTWDHQARINFRSSRIVTEGECEFRTRQRHGKNH